MLDVIVVVIIAVFAFVGYRKGFVMTVFNLFSLFIAFFLTIQLYPFAAKLLKSSDTIYNSIKMSVSETFGFSVNGILKATSGKADADVIKALTLPEFIKTPLLENNTPDVHRMLDALNIQDYVTGFVANAIINAIMMAIIFAVVFIAMRFVSATLQLIAMLPVIHTFNQFGGVLIGIAEGLLVVFVFMSIIGVMFALNPNFMIYDMFEQSIIAKALQQYNFIFTFVTQIFK